MAEMSKRFNFDDFDTLIAEALGEMDEERLQSALETDGTLADQIMPGQIGGVACNPSLLDIEQID